MALPLSWTRVYTALKRLMPPKFYSTDDNSQALKELASIAVALGVMADVVEAFFSELFPDSVTQAPERWEASFQVPVRRGDAIATRQARLVATIGRRAGYTLPQLADRLYSYFGFASSVGVVFVETTRAQIDAALTVTDSVAPAIDAPISRTFSTPWPGVVEDRGVRIRVFLAGGGGILPVITLKHVDGTSWTVFDGTAPGAIAWPDGAWLETRTLFTGKVAGMPWSLSVTDPAATGVQYISSQLIVSNDIDSAQIYRFYAQRDPNTAGTQPDLVEAQRIFDHGAPAHRWTKVCERNNFIVGDAHSLCGRDPIGS